MKIVLVGASGDVGQAAFGELSKRHDVIRAGRHSADVIVDIGDLGSIEAMYDTVGTFDAVVSTAGNVHFAPLFEFTEATFHLGLQNKVMGQVNLVLAGMARITAHGSFTLTSGVLDRDPVVSGAAAATANAALAGFATGAAIELQRGVRINVVSPGLLEVSEERYGGFFPGHERVSSAKVGRAFAKCVEGAITGQVVPVG
ncbi:MAG: short chain dehydrogenase [Roseobacter sp.]